MNARALNFADRIEIRGLENRLSKHLPATVRVGTDGYAMVFRAGVIVFFDVDEGAQTTFIEELGPRVQGKYDNPEWENAVIRSGAEDAIEPDALILKECTIERLQVVAEILAKSVVLGRNERQIWREFRAIEPLAQAMQKEPGRLPWKQRDLVRQIGAMLIVENQLVDRAEVLEKPELLWDRPDLDRLYARLEEEYELRERHAVLETKLAAISNSARTMLELTQARKSMNVEYWIVGLIVFEILLTLQERFL
jgi:uncharacterized Rmd1/YagE family protein